MGDNINLLAAGRIDAHQHFWKYHPVKDAWVTDDMKVLQKDFMPQDLQPILLQNNFEGCVAVQADQSVDETKFLLSLAAANPFIKGIVGWIDLCAGDVEEKLKGYSSFKKLKGFRHILQAEADGFMLQPDFLNGISLLQQYNFTYDILVYARQLPQVLQLIEKFPEQKFIIDHLAKPDIKNKEQQQWAAYITAIAQHKNVYCKLSGMVTEANWHNWQLADFSFYIQTIIGQFGKSRVMFGSDWPVCLLAAKYKTVIDIAEQHTRYFTKDELQGLWRNNCINFYQLN
jgi:L-fuconolactonase